jgi:O-antigen ligase
MDSYNSQTSLKSVNTKSARAAFDYCKGFTAYFLLLLYIIIPVIALALSYILRWPAAYLLHDIFISVGSLIIVFAILVIFFASAGFKRTVFKLYIRSHTYTVFFALLFVWAFVSYLLAGDTKTALFGVAFRYNGFLTWLIYISAALVCSCIRSSNNAEKYKRRLLKVFICVSFIMSCVMLCQNYGVKFITELNGSRNQSVLLNPNHFGYILTMSILCLGGLLVSQNKFIPALFYGLLFTFECWVLTINGSFGCELAVFIALLLMIPVYKLSTAYNNKLWAALLPLVIFMAVYIMSGSLTSGRNGSDAASLVSDAKTIIEDAVSGGEAAKKPLYNNDRFELWKAVTGYASEKPLFGWGPDSIGKLFTSDGFTNTAAHNEYLQLAAEIGFPGLIFYLAGLIALFITLLKRIIRSKNKSADILSPSAVTAFGASVSYLISAFFGVSLFYSAMYLYVMLALSASD